MNNPFASIKKQIPMKTKTNFAFPPVWTTICKGATCMLVAFVLTACDPKAAQSLPSAPQTDSTSVETADTLSTAEAPEAQPQSKGLTFAMAQTMVSPGQQYDEQAIDSLFAAASLPKVQAERYIWDADFGGNSPAISYVWGNGVELKNGEVKATEDDYLGAQFNFFFDKSKKTGSLKSITIIASDAAWYEQFMSDAKAAGLTLSGDLDKVVYQREGKEYMLKTGEQTYYYINDFSADGKYEVEVGFNNGMDI